MTKVALEENPAPRRRHPWGNDELDADQPDPDRANFDQTGIGRPSAVDCFPDGRSPVGCEDMSGNVWEWTSTIWGPYDRETNQVELKYPYPYQSDDGLEALTKDDDLLRVLRGGSFLSHYRLVRCAVRFRSGPGNWLNSYGFRVVLSPFTSES